MRAPTFCDAGAQRGNVNMHIHSHFSFNSENWSPTRIAEEATASGLDAAGLIDFDVLDGMEEFFHAGERLGLRTIVGVETRVFYNEFGDMEIDSPGEPGVHYMDGIGFYRLPLSGTAAAEGLQKWRDNAQKRNAELIARINLHMQEIALDYEAQVIPLSPGGCPTERHIISAYIKQAEKKFSGKQLVTFWAHALNRSEEDTLPLLADKAKMADIVRSRFAKRGGFGYVQPTAESFPSMNEFIEWVKACGAIPMESWLDGTSEGELDAERLLDTSIDKGCRAFNIIPDRNWSIANKDEKAVKTGNLRKIVTLADARHLPINIGTEMNKAGLPFADDLSGPVLREFAKIFHRGAMTLVGHTICARFANFGYLTDAAAQTFPAVEKRNAFFASVGEMPPVTVPVADALRNAGYEKAFEIINNALRTGAWPS